MNYRKASSARLQGVVRHGVRQFNRMTGKIQALNENFKQKSQAIFWTNENSLQEMATMLETRKEMSNRANLWMDRAVTARITLLSR